MSLPWSKPRRLGRTPHSRTQVPQRLLTRLRRGRLCPGRLPRARVTDSRVCGQAAIIGAVLTSLPAFRP
jgi:hypothetical protein